MPVGLVDMAEPAIASRYIRRAVDTGAGELLRTVVLRPREEIIGIGRVHIAAIILRHVKTVVLIGKCRVGGIDIGRIINAAVVPVNQPA